ncbi:hypothetical protein MVEN_01383000 [Mycena venus]|uniref:Uncharacterized protein n=1 Tax=Mycena venus TaxID=2733690 RepID=A0A8H6XUZ7_9AGAR|nr:hypothetical protein MVEN_01383000 [Mycena venus]
MMSRTRLPSTPPTPTQGGSSHFQATNAGLSQASPTLSLHSSVGMHTPPQGHAPYPTMGPQFPVHWYHPSLSRPSYPLGMGNHVIPPFAGLYQISQTNPSPSTISSSDVFTSVGQPLDPPVVNANLNATPSNIDPTLLTTASDVDISKPNEEASTSEHEETSQVENQSDGKDSDAGDDSGGEDSGGEDSDPGPPTQRQRVTVKNPKYGYVAGAMKGVNQMQILRPRELPKIHKDPTRRFNVLMPEIIARCERLGAETGCWLMLAGAHKGSGAQELHYTSPALRADAPEATTKVLNDFRLLIGGLKKARRAAAVSMGIALTEAEAAKAAAEDKAKRMEMELAEQRALIAQLRSDSAASQNLSAENGE